MMKLSRLLKQFNVKVIEITKVDWSGHDWMVPATGVNQPKIIHTGKMKLSGLAVSYGSPRTIIHNPNAEVIAWFSDTHFGVGICRTKRKLKGFLVSKTHYGFTGMLELDPKEALIMIKKLRKFKNISFIDDEAISEVVIKEL